MGKPASGQQLQADPSWRWVGERGLRVATGDTTLARYASLLSKTLPDVDDIIPADGSILLILRRGAGLSHEVKVALTEPLTALYELAHGRTHEIVVEYGGVAGPDLPVLAKRADLSPAAYIDRHAAVEYSVAFLGFQPGFPYLRGLPAALQAMRRASPRTRVPAGSVAVGGTYTGIYPAAGPGGWHIIGRTSATLFDPERTAPVLLMPGDQVRFVPA